MKRISKRKREANLRRSEKIEKLQREGVPDGKGQAAAMAYSMERAGRLRRHGRYVRKGRRR